MAEYLIYDKLHWMDELPEEELDNRKKDPAFFEKYSIRNQKGDIIEVRPDGYWTGKDAKGFNKKAFCVVVIPNEPVDKNLQSAHEIKENTGTLESKSTILKKNRFNIDTSLLTFKDSISSIEKKDTLLYDSMAVL